MKARCSMTEDKKPFACEFREVDGGGWEITARGKPKLSLYPDSADDDDIGKGLAAYIEFGEGHGVPIPGRFFRSREHPECWINDTSGHRIYIWIDP